MSGFRKSPIYPALIFVWGLSVVIASCGGDDATPVDPGNDPPVVADTTAPAAVTDLRLRVPTQTTLALVWSAPGDDGTTGTATRYDIRLSKSLITEANWDSASPLDPDVIPVPKPAGQIETIVITGLESGTVYHVALKTTDEASNESGLSNCCHEETLPETIPPSDVTDLGATAVDEASFELTWTAPGDDHAIGTATRYDIRYSSRIIQTEQEFENATVIANPPAPKPSGERESFTVSGLTPGSYCFVIKTADDMDNWSGLSNFAVGLGYNEALWYGPTVVSPGGYVYVVFRANDAGKTRVTIHEPNSRHYCGENAVIDLVYEILPSGIYKSTYDFVDRDTGQYLPTGWYSVSLCYDNSVIEWRWLGFNFE